MRSFTDSNWREAASLSVMADKVCAAFQSVRDKTSKRLEAAMQRFQAQYDLQMKIAGIDWGTTNGPTKTVLAGFLVSIPDQKWIALYAGKNHYAVKEGPSGKELQVKPGLAPTIEQEILEVGENSMVVHAADKRTVHITNEIVKIQGQDFCVKILSVPHRCEMSFRSEGGAM